MSDDVCYVTGLDLGPAQEFTAIAVLERTRVAVGEEPSRTPSPPESTHG